MFPLICNMCVWGFSEHLPPLCSCTKTHFSKRSLGGTFSSMLPLLCVKTSYVCSRQYVHQLCADNGKRALMYHKAEPCKSLYMIEIWPLHTLESWPWILVLCLAARIRGNLPQTHILLREICAYFASALFSKMQNKATFELQSVAIDRKGKDCAWGWFFSYHFLFVSKVGRAERQRNLLIFISVSREDFAKVKLNSWATRPPHKLMVYLFIFCLFMKRITDVVWRAEWYLDWSANITYL